MKKIILAVLALALSNPVFAFRTIPYKEIKPLHFGSINKITTCGSWEKGEKGGSFRVIELWLYGGDKLFVDMVSPNKNGSEEIVVYGFTFDEINSDHADLTLTNIRCKPGKPNTIRITGDAAYEDNKYSFEITVDGKSRTYTYKDTLPKK